MLNIGSKSGGILEMPDTQTLRSSFKRWMAASGHAKRKDVISAIQTLFNYTPASASKNYNQWLKARDGDEAKPEWEAKLFAALCTLPGFKEKFGDAPLVWEEQQKKPEEVLEERRKAHESKRRALRGEETSGGDVPIGVGRDDLYRYFETMDVRLAKADGRGDCAVARQLTQAIAIAHEAAGNWPDAARHFEQLVDWCQLLEEPSAAVEARLRQGLALYRSERFELAVTCLRGVIEALDASPELKKASSLRIEAEACDYLAMSLLRLNQSIPEARQLLEVRSKQLWDQMLTPLGLAAWQHRLALVLMGCEGENEMALAKSLLLDGLETRLRLRADTECGRSLNNLAIWHYQQKELLQARMILMLCDLLQTCSKDDIGRMKTYFYLGRVYASLYTKHLRDPDQERELVHDIDDKLLFPDERERRLVSNVCDKRHRRARRRALAIKLHRHNAIHYFRECLKLSATSMRRLLAEQANDELIKLGAKDSAVR